MVEMAIFLYIKNYYKMAIFTINYGNFFIVRVCPTFTMRHGNFYYNVFLSVDISPTFHLEKNEPSKSIRL